MKIVLINQARMTSTRLPGKVMKTVLDKPLLEYQIERLKQAVWLDDIVIALTTNDTDQPIIDLCNNLSIKYFRGSEENVLERYYLAAKEHDADVIIRVTSDCPLIDPDIIDKTINLFISYDYDYVSNCPETNRTFPRGMETEVFYFSAIEQAFKNATEKPEKEHVTPYIYKNPDKFKLNFLNNDLDESNYRLTVDTIEDFELIKNILESLYTTNKDFRLTDIIKLLKENPEWLKINTDIQQKKYGE